MYNKFISGSRNVKNDGDGLNPKNSSNRSFTPKIYS